MSEMRIGHGYDVHALVVGRPLIIGGVKIEHEKGLDGHSDADVLLHAIGDALLGACSMADIGQHFPPSDPKYKGADSSELLKHLFELTKTNGLIRIVNLDSVIMAERPRLNRYVYDMKKNISNILNLSVDRIGIKATTTEKLGFIGREEGIASSAVILVEFNG